MSMRYQAAIIKPGFNPLGTQTSVYQNAMYSWGKNTNGQLGLGDATNRSSPVQIGALTTWYQVAQGQISALATKNDGTLWGWGNNSYGQLGLGNTTYYSSPVQVGTMNNKEKTCMEKGIKIMSLEEFKKLI